MRRAISRAIVVFPMPLPAVKRRALPVKDIHDDKEPGRRLLPLARSLDLPFLAYLEHLIKSSHLARISPTPASVWLARPSACCCFTSESVLTTGPIRLREEVFSLAISGDINLQQEQSDQHGSTGRQRPFGPNNKLAQVGYLPDLVPIFYSPRGVDIAFASPYRPEKNLVHWHTLKSPQDGFPILSNGSRFRRFPLAGLCISW